MFGGKDAFEGWIKAGTLISHFLPFKHLSRSSDVLLWNMIYLLKKKSGDDKLEIIAFFIAFM